jgi:hypothetical protein
VSNLTVSNLTEASSTLCGDIRTTTGGAGEADRPVASAGTIDSDILSALLDISIDDRSTHTNEEDGHGNGDAMAENDLDIDRPHLQGYASGDTDPNKDPRLKPHNEFVLEDILYTLVNGDEEPDGFRMVHLLDESVTVRQTGLVQDGVDSEGRVKPIPMEGLWADSRRPFNNRRLDIFFLNHIFNYLW